METIKTRHKYWIKIIAMVVVCLFTVNTIAWAYPDSKISLNGDELQVQSIFNPILSEIGNEHETQLRMETALILATALRYEETYQDINITMDEWYALIREKMERTMEDWYDKNKPHNYNPDIEKRRILTVLPGIKKGDGGIEIEVGFLGREEDGPRFKITSACKNIADIEFGIGKEGEDLVRIDRIPADGKIVKKGKSVLNDKKTEEIRGLLENWKRRPEPLEVLKYTEEEIKRGAKSAFDLDEEYIEKIKGSITYGTELDNILFYVRQIVEHILQEYPQHKILVLGRDAEVFYDAFKALFAWTPRKNDVSLFPGSEAFWEKFQDYPLDVKQGFIESFGITRDAIESGQKFLMIDTGLYGTISENVHHTVSELYGYTIEDTQRMIVSRLVGTEDTSYAKELVRFERDVTGEDADMIKFPKTAALLKDLQEAKTGGDDHLRKKYGYLWTFNFLLAIALQLLPNHHDVYSELEEQEDGSLAAVPGGRGEILDDIDRVTGINQSIVNPVAAMLIQRRVVDYFASRRHHYQIYGENAPRGESDRIPLRHFTPKRRVRPAKSLLAVDKGEGEPGRVPDPSDFAKKIVNEVGIASGAKVLSLGAGNFQDEMFFADKGCRVTAVEKKRRDIKERPNITAKWDDMRDVLRGSKDGEFDVVYARLSLHYFQREELERIFEQISRVLVPGGRLCFMVRSKKDWQYLQTIAEGEKEAPDTWLTAYCESLEKDKRHERQFFDEERVERYLTLDSVDLLLDECSEVSEKLSLTSDATKGLDRQEFVFLEAIATKPAKPDHYPVPEEKKNPRKITTLGKLLANMFVMGVFIAVYYFIACPDVCLIGLGMASLAGLLDLFFMRLPGSRFPFIRRFSRILGIRMLAEKTDENRLIDIFDNDRSEYRVEYTEDVEYVEVRETDDGEKVLFVNKKAVSRYPKPLQWYLFGAHELVHLRGYGEITAYSVKPVSIFLGTLIAPVFFLPPYIGAIAGLAAAIFFTKFITDGKKRYFAPKLVLSIWMNILFVVAPLYVFSPETLEPLDWTPPTQEQTDRVRRERTEPPEPMTPEQQEEAERKAQEEFVRRVHRSGLVDEKRLRMMADAFRWLHESMEEEDILASVYGKPSSEVTADEKVSLFGLCLFTILQESGLLQFEKNRHSSASGISQVLKDTLNELWNKYETRYQIFSRLFGPEEWADPCEFDKDEWRKRVGFNGTKDPKKIDETLRLNMAFAILYYADRGHLAAELSETQKRVESSIKAQKEKLEKLKKKGAGKRNKIKRMEGLLQSIEKNFEKYKGLKNWVSERWGVTYHTGLKGRNLKALNEALKGACQLAEKMKKHDKYFESNYGQKTALYLLSEHLSSLLSTGEEIAAPVPEEMEITDKEIEVLLGRPLNLQLFLIECMIFMSLVYLISDALCRWVVREDDLSDEIPYSPEQPGDGGKKRGSSGMPRRSFLFLLAGTVLGAGLANKIRPMPPVEAAGPSQEQLVPTLSEKNILAMAYKYRSVNLYNEIGDKTKIVALLDFFQHCAAISLMRGEPVILTKSVLAVLVGAEGMEIIPWQHVDKIVFIPDRKNNRAQMIVRCTFPGRRKKWPHTVVTKKGKKEKFLIPECFSLMIGKYHDEKDPDSMKGYRGMYAVSEKEYLVAKDKDGTRFGKIRKVLKVPVVGEQHLPLNYVLRDDKGVIYANAYLGRLNLWFYKKELTWTLTKNPRAITLGEVWMDDHPASEDDKKNLPKEFEEIKEKGIVNIDLASLRKEKETKTAKRPDEREPAKPPKAPVPTLAAGAAMFGQRHGPLFTKGVGYYYASEVPTREVEKTLRRWFARGEEARDFKKIRWDHVTKEGILVKLESEKGELLGLSIARKIPSLPGGAFSHHLMEITREHRGKGLRRVLIAKQVEAAYDRLPMNRRDDDPVLMLEASGSRVDSITEDKIVEVMGYFEGLGFKKCILSGTQASHAAREEQNPQFLFCAGRINELMESAGLPRKRAHITRTAQRRVSRPARSAPVRPVVEEQSGRRIGRQKELFPDDTDQDTSHFKALRLKGAKADFTPQDAEDMKKDKAEAREKVPGVRGPEDKEEMDLFDMTKDDLGRLAKALYPGECNSEGKTGALIHKAFSALEKWAEDDSSIDLTRVKNKNILVSLIGKDRSKYLFEDCAENDFVGINSTLLEIARDNPRIARVLFVVGIAHELRHEAGGEVDEANMYFEVSLMQRLLVEEGIDMDNVIAVLEPVLEGLLFVDQLIGYYLETLAPKVRKTYQNAASFITSNTGLLDSSKRRSVEYYLDRLSLSVGKAAGGASSAIMVTKDALKKLEVTPDNIVEELADVSAKLIDIARAGRTGDLMLFSVVRDIVNMDDVTGADIKGVLASLVRISQVTGRASTGAIDAAGEIVDKLRVSPKPVNIKDVLDSLVEPFKEIRQARGAEDPQLFGALRSIMVRQEVNSDNYKGVLAELVDICDATGASSTHALISAGVILREQGVTPDNICKILDGLVESFGKIARSRGVDDPELFSRVWNILNRPEVTGGNVQEVLIALVDISQATGTGLARALRTAGIILQKEEATSENFVEKLAGLVGPFRDISGSAGASSQKTFEVISKILEREEFGKENVREALGALAGICRVSGRAAPDALLVAGRALEVHETRGFGAGPQEGPVAVLEGLVPRFEMFSGKITEATSGVSEPVSLLVSIILYGNVCRVFWVDGKLDAIINDQIVLLESGGYKGVLEKAPGLEAIKIREQGLARNRSKLSARSLLEHGPALDTTRPEGLPEESGHVKPETVRALEELKENAKMQGQLKFVKAMGRSLVFEDEAGERLVIKLRKKGEAVSDLEHEARMLEWARGRYRAGEVSQLPPEPVRMEGEGYCFSFDLDWLERPVRKDVREALDRAVREAREKVISFELDKDHVAFAYKIPADSRYDGYITANKNEGEFKKAILSAASDLGALAKEGMIHTALVDIFHNVGGGGRRYIWSVELHDVLERLGTEGAGRLTAWRLALAFPNIGEDGAIRDWAEVRPVQDVLDNIGKYLSEEGKFFVDQFGDKSSNFVMLHFLGEYALAMALFYGDWLIENKKMPDWKDDEALAEMEEFMKDIYFTIASSYSGAGRREMEEELSSLVDWQRMARQMAFYMSTAYILYVDEEKGDGREKDFPGKMYGENVSVTFGDYRPGTFDLKVGFKGDAAENERVRDAAALGPVNGPLVTQELITANYHLFGAVVSMRTGADAAMSDQGPKERPGPGDANVADRKFRARKRRVEKRITRTNLRSAGLLNGRDRVKVDGKEKDVSLRKALDLANTKSKKTPVDVVVDLSLISKSEKELAANATTWAYLILLCRDSENVSFVFKSCPMLDEEEDSPDPRTDKFLDLLRQEIRDKAILCECDEKEIDKLIDERVRYTRSEKEAKGEEPVEIFVTSKKWLKWARKSGIELKTNQYPVAMDGAVAVEETGVALRNFEAALTIGLSKAALVIAKRKDKETGRDEELPKLRKYMQQKLDEIYKVAFGEEVRITEKTLDGMIHHASAVRLNLAISLALPPIVRMPVDRLEEFHEHIQRALRAA